MTGAYIELSQLHRYLRDQELRAVRAVDERRVYVVDPAEVRALAARMRDGVSARKQGRALLDRVRLVWAKETA